MDNNGKFEIRCLFRDSHISGVFIDDKGIAIASYEQMLSNDTANISFACWGLESLYQKVCKTLCGELIDGSWCSK